MRRRRTPAPRELTQRQLHEPTASASPRRRPTARSRRAGGEITKQARNWLANALDATQRRSIIFMDRNDILDLFIVTNLPLPAAALPLPTWPDEPPF